MCNWLAAVAAAVFGLLAHGAALAEDYPARAITMIVPFPAGGAADTLARYRGERMRSILGQPVVIENIGGAAGSLGVARAARSPPTAIRSVSARRPPTCSPAASMRCRSICRPTWNP